jgi:hypothetical protein
MPCRPADMPQRAPAPVDGWHPDVEGPIDIRIDLDGSWFHEGQPIRRAALVALFASILRREPDGGTCWSRQRKSGSSRLRTWRL